MKAVRFDKYGGIDVLKVEDVPVLEPDEGAAQVKVKAASINPGEASRRQPPVPDIPLADSTRLQNPNLRSCRRRSSAR